MCGFFMSMSLNLLLILIYIVNMLIVLIRYLQREMVINVFLLLNILSDNSKY